MGTDGTGYGAAWDSKGVKLAWDLAFGSSLCVLDTRTGKETKLHGPVAKEAAGPGNARGQLYPMGRIAWARDSGSVLIGTSASDDIVSDAGFWQFFLDRRQQPRMLFPAKGRFEDATWSEPKVSADGRLLAVGHQWEYDTMVLQFYDLNADRPFQPKPYSRSRVKTLAAFDWLPGGTHMLLASRLPEVVDEQTGTLQTKGGGTIWKWDLMSGDVASVFEDPSSIHSITVSPDGKQVAYLAGPRMVGESALKVLNLAGKSSRSLLSADFDADSASISWAPDSRHLAICGSAAEGTDLQIWVIDTATGKATVLSRTAEFPAWSPR